MGLLRLLALLERPIFRGWGKDAVAELEELAVPVSDAASGLPCLRRLWTSSIISRRGDLLRQDGFARADRIGWDDAPHRPRSRPVDGRRAVRHDPRLRQLLEHRPKLYFGLDI